MGYDNAQRGSAGTVVAIVAVILVLLLGGIFLLGVGALFFVRASARQAEVVARMEAERAVVELEKAQEVAARVQVREAAKVEVQQTPPRDLIIEINQDGAITVDNVSTDLDGLRARIEKDSENGNARLAVQLKADPRCLAQHVVAVYSICRELSVEDVHVSTLEGP
jgi:biopolymer transport protein ExbD